MVPGTEAPAGNDLNFGEAWIREHHAALIKQLIPRKLNTFDFDGVIYLNPDITGVHPGPHDLIVTGRSFEEGEKVKGRLAARGITNLVFLNPLPWAERSRETSGAHKARVLRLLLEAGFAVGAHFEDDEVQAEVIARHVPEVHLVMLVHKLTTKDFREKLKLGSKW